ncbi:MAG: hypothetical protein RLZZ283_151 [Candidatus Parcubacteria bacterium]|jgi:hypothetical protein
MKVREFLKHPLEGVHERFQYVSRSDLEARRTRALKVRGTQMIDTRRFSVCGDCDGRGEIQIRRGADAPQSGFTTFSCPNGRCVEGLVLKV